MPTSPAATTMPGGAPLSGTSSKRACKYGPRDAAGHCPKKPRSSASSSARKTSSGGRSKPPCKYGPRDSSGHCPKKPKTPRNAKAPTVRDYEGVTAAGRQAGRVLRSSKATKEQKHEAVRVLGQAIAVESTKKVGEHIAREARKAIREPHVKEALKTAATTYGVPLAKATGIGALIAGTLAAGGVALDRNRDKEARAWADAQLAATRKQLGAQLTADQAKILWQQYYDFKAKQPVVNPYLGK